MSTKTNRQRGKRHQKKIAEKLNGLNLGTLGATDVLTEDFAIECKSRQKFVGEVWYEQAEKYAKGKIPIVIIHIKGKNYDNDYVLIKLKHFKPLIEGTKK